MTEQLARVIPVADQSIVLRIGGDDPYRTKQILLAMYGFLVDKPTNTRRTYRAGLKQFFDLIGWKDPKLVSVAEAAHYKRWLVDRGFSNSTVCTRLAAVDGFFDFLTKPVGEDGKQLLASNPFSVITRKDVLPTPFGRAKQVEWNQFRLMVDSLPSDAVGIRNKAVLIFAAYTGRRRAEIAKLRVRDLDLKGKPRTYSVIVKGGKLKTFELPKICYDAIRAHWISADRLKAITSESAVFSPVKTCPLTEGMNPERAMHHNVISMIVKDAAKAAGMDPSKVSVHALRHMVASDLDKAGARLQDIQRFLGHAQPNTTAIYLQALRGPIPAMQDELAKIRGAAFAIANPIIEDDDDA
jgi:integrase/recombinase XerD